MTPKSNKHIHNDFIEDTTTPKMSTPAPSKAPPPRKERAEQNGFAHAYAQREDTKSNEYYNTTQPASLQVSLLRFFSSNAFTPQWFPEVWRHPAIGYLLGIVLEVLGAIGTILIMHIFPTFLFSGLFEILGIAIIALNFGAGPSVLATIVGAMLLNMFVLPTRVSFSLDSLQNLTEIILFLLVGITISIVASQVERARRDATEERTLLNAVIETVPDSVSVYDAHGQLVRLNSAGRRMDESDIHSPALTMTTERLRTATGRFFPQKEFPIGRALKGETVHSVEMVWRPYSGDTQYFTVSAAPLYNAWGKIGGAVSISHDVTALRRSEQAASASTSELEATFESITDGVFVFNQEGHVIRMNMAFRELLGIQVHPDYFSHSPDERRQLFTIADEQDQPLPYEQWPQNRILRGESLKGETAVDIRVRTVDERHILMSVSGAPVYTQDGKLMGGVVICRDITERKRMETYTQNALHALLEMAQTLIQGPEEMAHETMDEPSANTVVQRLVELTSRVLNCKRVGIISVLPENERLLPVAIVGLTIEQEHSWWGHMPQCHLSDMTDPAGVEQLRNGDVVRLDATLHQADQHYAQHGPTNSLLAPMAVGKKIVGLLSLDYADAKHTYTLEEMALAGAVAKLAALVLERERLIVERSEAQANEIALSEANQRMTEFLGIASHELKTPITTIKGSTQLLERRLKKMMDLETTTLEERTRLREESQDLLRRTNTQVNRLIRLINDLLDMSRIQAHKIEPHMEDTNLANVLQDVVQEQSRSAVDRIITLQISSSEEIAVHADIDRIEQVLTNFISNALKYSAPDKPIEVLLQKRGLEAYVAVCDNGPGIAKQEQSRVFERFYRAKGIEIRSGSGVGLGLGLYISKTIIDLHKGDIGVDSEVGKGSTFWFTLPLAEKGEHNGYS